VGCLPLRCGMHMSACFSQREMRWE